MLTHGMRAINGVNIQVCDESGKMSGAGGQPQRASIVYKMGVARRLIHTISLEQEGNELGCCLG
jgi:hypothetical protein